MREGKPCDRVRKCVRERGKVTEMRGVGVEGREREGGTEDNKKEATR